MRRVNQHDSARSRRQSRSRGIALITTLLLLLLMTGMSIAMVLSVNSDMLINGYYRNFRASFYAADSGLNIARQALANQLLAAVPTTLTATQQPIATGTEATVVNNINTSYGASYQPLTGSGQAARSWPEKYKLDATKTSLTLASCTVVGGGGTCAAPTGSVTGYQYIYNYSLTSLGQSQGTEAATVSDSGSLILNASVAPSATTTSFAAWGMFIDQYTICSGSYLVPGTISGPVFTNGAWTFGTSGSYIFTDAFGSASANVGYQFSGSCQQVAAASDKYKGVTIAPQFQSTFNLGQPAVPLPANDYNQKRAVLDGTGSNSAAVTNSDLNAHLRNVNQTAYPATGATSGVYLPYTVNPVTGVATLNGGGIYVEGNAGVTLSPSGSSAQVYNITQGTTTTTITIDPTLNTTTVSSGGTNLTIQGVPQQHDPTSGAVTGNASMLYVNGNITSLSGPGQGQAAINDGTALTVSASGNVAVTGDILYKSEPVTLTQNQIPGTPADTLIPANNHGQTLGIFTATGDIQLKNGQSNGNLEIDASLATISQGGTGGLVNVGSAINTLTIVGGRIQNQIKNIGATTRNVFFDRRYAQNGFSPPWFPSTTVTTSGYSATITPQFQRTHWVNQTSYF